MLRSWPVNDTTFIDRQRYELEILAYDLASNASVTEGGTLTFKNVFMNPSADVFKVVPDATLKEKQVAGVDYTIDLTVVDTTLTKVEKAKDSAAGDVLAVTYRTPSAIAAIVSADQADALEGASFSGTGVVEAPQVPFQLPPPVGPVMYSRPLSWTKPGGSRVRGRSSSSPRSRSRT